MRYKLLGRSGLRVSELALGTMTFGETWGWGASREESGRILDAFLDAGGNFVDTACNYTDGESERLLGEFVQERRERLVLATKYTLTARKDDPNAGGNHRKNLMQTVEASLRRLRTDYVDLLWLHMWDGLTPIEEVVRALDDLVTAGKVLYVGLSDTPAWVVARAVTMAELSGRARPVALQLPYSLGDRSPENELLPMADELELAVTAWGVLSGGALTAKYLAEADEPRRYDHVGDRVNAIAREVAAVAGEAGATPAQVAAAWVLEQPWPLIPILGARTEAQLRENLAALDVELTAEQVERLDGASGFRLGFPRSFLESEDVRELIFGDTFGLIDDRRRPSRRRSVESVAG